MNNKKMITISLFLSMAIILSYIERMIPTPFLVAGAKLGLTNIITITTLVLLDNKSSFLIIILRVTLVSLLFAGFSGFLYSITGGLLSYFGMSVMLKLNFKEVSLVGVSVIGAVLHSLGQVLVAMFIFSNANLLLYLPAVLLTSLITGIFVGLVANHLTERLIKAHII
ncbi:MAG: Gx transporter family protein [Clostridiales bacterium]|nr:Gx transporter family protein [Clostridiales bacterium]